MIPDRTARSGRMPMKRIAPKPRILNDTKPIFSFSPHRLTDRLTPLEFVFGTSDLGIPEVEVADWKLDIAGLVNNPISLSFDDLKGDRKSTRLNSSHLGISYAVF